MEKRKLTPEILAQLDTKLFVSNSIPGLTLRDALKALRNLTDGQRDHDIKASTGLPDEDCQLAASLGANLWNVDL